MTSFPAESPKSTPPFVNPDQELIHRFLADGGRPIPFDANPMARALHAELHGANLEAGRVELVFAPDPLFIQGTGVLQGGAVIAMLDFAMAFATLAYLPVGASCATVNLNAAFLRAAPEGRYTSIGHVERCGRQLAFTHARLLRGADRTVGAHEGTVVATATSSLVVSPPR